MKIIVGLFAAWLMFLSCSGSTVSVQEVGIIPMPNQIIEGQGKYILQGEKRVAIASGEASMSVFQFLQNALKNTTVILKSVPATEQADIYLLMDDSLPDEAYTLEVSSDDIKICSNATGTGLFYGVQSLLQLMPAEIYNTVHKCTEQIEIPAIRIVDAPRFSYRGAMMDVGRNFLPKEEVLKFLDLMAMYKLNKFHFHLTDDQGWRIEIKKYPRLIEVGSRRNQTQVGHCDYYYPRRFDGKEQKGYYTQEDIREIVQYAADRFITVIPEIEMPGHASAALAAYPGLSCGLGKKYVVRDYFDVFDEVYCPKEGTFKFLEDVLTEIIDLFPSHYIHIGGDECPKKAWKKCDHCQALMRREGLPDEEALQSWFIRRMEKFVNSKGRDIIGWDEILEGGLAPNATVMSWRGEAGGIEAARQKHKVIMTPGKSCYFDYYQENPAFAPLAIGGFLPLDSVYAYNPLPASLSSEEQSYIIGVQANIWGEYIQTSEYFEYMAFPRLLAMAEVQWTQPEFKDFSTFTRRLDKEFKKLDYCDVNACRNFYEVNLTGTWDTSQKVYQVTLNTFCPDAEIYYAVNDSVISLSSNRYTVPIRLAADATVYAAVYREGKSMGKATHETFTVNKATGCFYNSSPLPLEKADAGIGLTDGIRGYARNLHHWTIFNGDTVRVTIDLEKPTSLSKVAFTSLWRPYNTLWPVGGLLVSTSEDGKIFTPVGNRRFDYDFTITEGTHFPVSFSFPVTKARYVSLYFLNGGLCPKGYYDEGQPSKLALDEIEIY